MNTFCHLASLECKKIFASQSFIRFWLLLLCIYCFFSIRAETSTEGGGYQPAEYEALYSVLSSWEPEEAVQKLGVFRDAWESQEAWSIQGTADARAAELVRESPFAPCLPENAWQASRLLDDVYLEVSTVVGRQKLLSDTVKNAERLSSLSLFQDSASDADRGNVEKTGRDFAAASQVPVKALYPEKGFRMCMDAPLGDILVLVLCFLLVHQMVGLGYANGMEKMVLSCREGAGKAAVARSFAIFLASGVVWASFFAARAVCALSLYSMPSFTAPVQLLSSYVKCLLPMTVRGLFAVAFIWKWLWFGFLSLLFLSLLKAFQTEIPGFLLVILSWGVGYAMYSRIAENSVFRFWRYGNLYVLLRPDLFWASYQNLHLGTAWVDSYWVALGITMLFAAAVILACCLLRARLPVKQPGKWFRLTQKRPSFRGLVGGEFYKSYVAMPLAAVLLCLAAFQWFQYRGDTIRIGQEEAVYRSYMTKWERPLSGPDAALEEEMDTEEAELARAMAGKSQVYTQDVARILSPVFNRVRQRYRDALAVLEERQQSVLFFWEGQYGRLVGSPRHDMQHGAEASACVVLFMAACVGREYASGMRRMIRSTGPGEARYGKGKLLWLATAVLLLVLLIYGPDAWVTWKTYQPSSLGAFVGSIPSLSRFPLPVTIGGYLAILALQRFLVLMLVGMLVMAAVEVCKSGMLGALLSGVLVMLPYLLYYLGQQSGSGWGLAWLLSGNAVWQMTGIH